MSGRRRFMRSRSAKSLRAIVRTLLGATSVLSCAVTAAAAEHADIVIHGGPDYTGAETPSFVRDVVVTGDKVVDGRPDAGARYQARQVVDAHRQSNSPGLIDS